jgi:hypothetical protein
MDKQPPSFEFETPAYHKHPTDTEVTAAESQSKTLGASRRAVYEYLLAHGPHTDEELVVALDMHSARRRRSDLKNAGLVRDSGERGESSCGKPMIRWEVVPR